MQPESLIKARRLDQCLLIKAQALAVRGGPEVRVTLLELEQCTSHRHCGTIVNVECRPVMTLYFAVALPVQRRLGL